MRLVHYYPRAVVGDGGPTRAMWEWAGAAHSAGCDVAILYDADLEARSELRRPALALIPLTHVGVGRLRIPQGLPGVLDADDVLVLHSAYVPGNLAVASIARRHGVPYVVMPHGGYDARSVRRRRYRKLLWRFLERQYLESALAVHLFFETEVSDAARIAPKARWLIAPTGFDLPAATWDGGTGGYLAWLGRYDIRHKGLDVLIQALSQLPSPNCTVLRLHGKPSENSLEDVELLADSAGVRPLVSVRGPVSGASKAEFLTQAVSYVHPSRWESHSLALIEALAYGIPSVVSASCSIAPILRAWDAAVVVDSTPHGIAGGIAVALRNQQYYSDRSRNFVRQRFAWPVVIDEFLMNIHELRTGTEPPILRNRHTSPPSAPPQC